MPNPQNISSPINIHGFGRSGTTVLQNILGAAGFIQVCNETAPLVFNCYRGGELLLPSHDKEVIGLPGDASAAVQAVHAAFCSTLQSRKSSWCQKLGGIPNSVVWDAIKTDEDRAYATLPYEFPYAWYWRVLKTVFPHSLDILILRDWRDIVASRVEYSGYAPISVASDLAVYWTAMAHPDAKLDHIVNLTDLAKTPHHVISRIFELLGLSFDEATLDAMDWYASGTGRDLVQSREIGFSRHERFEQFDTVLQHKLAAIVAPAVARIRKQFPTAQV